jgi:ribosomal protein L17
VKQYLYTEPAQKAFVQRMKQSTATSGFLRTTKVGFRKGDAAEVTMVEYVK